MKSDLDYEALQDLLNIAPGFFGYLCAEGKILDLNDSSLRIVGARRGEVLGLNFWDGPWWTSLPDSQAKLREGIELAKKGQTQIFDIQFWAKPDGKNSESRFSELHITPELDESGEVKRIAVCGVDITKRARANEELAAERRKLEMIFDQTPAAMATWRGPDLTFEMVNPEYQNIFKGRQLVGLPLLEAVPELKEQPFYYLMKKVYETGEPYVAREMLAKIADPETGEIRDHYYDFVYSQIKDSEGRPYGVYDHALDVTERVLNRKAMEETQEQLTELVQMLQEAKELRDSLSAAISHDLRTPLTVVQSSAELLEMSSKDSEVIELAKTISENIERADKMIQDILTAGQIKAGELVTLQRQDANLFQIARQSLEDMRIIHGDRFILEGDSDAEGYWDPGALRRVVENFVINAIKYGDLEKPITVSIKNMEEEVSLAVHNHGKPISKEDQKTIFDAYKRSPKQMGEQKGWGIGLTLVWGIAKAHGGEAVVKSSAAEGTTFSIKIPR